MKQIALAFLTLLFAVTLAAGQSSVARLNSHQLAKAERFWQQLQQFDNFINSGPLPDQYQTRAAKLAAEFNRAAAGLPESDVKTDLATSVYWYEQMALSLKQSAAAGSVAARCEKERPGAYQKLCETNSGSTRDLEWARARLHLQWAGAGILFQQTGRVARPLDDVAVERQIDRMLALGIIESLKVLQSKVIIYRSLGEFAVSGKLARVSFADFERDLRRVSAEAESKLDWLPQNLLKSELSNALHAFQDGAFWWEQIDQPRVVKVSDLAFGDARRPAAETVLLTSAPYTVASNWRQAGRYLQHATQLLNSQT